MSDSENSLELVLIQESGEPFDPQFLVSTENDLRALDNPSRRLYRDQNAEGIANRASHRILLVAGPGTGKSFLFIKRITFWLPLHANHTIFVTTFVRKLVGDLESEVKASEDIAPQDKSRVRVGTLHRIARSVLERASGTAELPFGRHIQVIGPEWKQVVWDDVLSLHPPSAQQFVELESQFHRLESPPSEEWQKLRATYFGLCQFYNAISFADSILHATEAIRGNPALLENSLWIIDEFQDFNEAEDSFIQACTEGSAGVFLAGDDDQALYQELKASHPEIIRSYYRDTGYENALLPYCSRCDSHITLAAASFLVRRRGSDSIEKIFLPLEVDESSTKVQVLITSTTSVAIDYVEGFIARKRAELEDRKTAILEGTKKDPFLLILSPSRESRFLDTKMANDQSERLAALVDEWRLEEAGPGEDYFRLLIYYRHHVNPLDNFTTRKVLHLENTPPRKMIEILRRALSSGSPLGALSEDAVIQARRKSSEIAQIILDDSMSSRAKADAISNLMFVGNMDRLIQDFESALLRSGDETGSEEREEEIETASTVSPVEMLTIIGSKGLSADHVIVLGFDNVNMSYVTWQAFLVAMTRARRSLHLMTAVGARGAVQPNGYLESIDETRCAFSKLTKSGQEMFGTKQEFDDYVASVSSRRGKFLRRRLK